MLCTSEAMKMVTAAENPYANFATAVHPFVHQFLYGGHRFLLALPGPCSALWLIPSLALHCGVNSVSEAYLFHHIVFLDLNNNVCFPAPFPALRECLAICSL